MNDKLFIASGEPLTMTLLYSDITVQEKEGKNTFTHCSK